MPSRFKRRLDPRFYTNPKNAIAQAERRQIAFARNNGVRLNTARGESIDGII
jgi:hypothetical protein